MEQPVTIPQAATILGVGRNTIRYWRQREWITPVGGTPFGSRTIELYRLSELRDVQMEQAARRENVKAAIRTVMERRRDGAT